MSDNTKCDKKPIPKTDKKTISRRGFVAGAAASPALFHIVPAHCLGGPKHTAPSETFGAALIGAGGRGPGTFRDLSGKHGLSIRKLAYCDVKYVGSADNKTRYTDFRRLLERKDLDIVAIATPPHWHALISIAAMEAGKDVVCEKPLTRTIAEGRAVVEASKRYGRILQVGTYGRFGASGNAGHRETHKIMRSGVKLPHEVVHHHRGGLKVKQWSGKVDLKPSDPPANLDWDMYCGPSPLKPFTGPRHGGTHRWFWDYDGGGLADMGQHKLDPLNWIYGRDDTSPTEITPYAPPAHPEVCGMWGWVEMKYADGFTLVVESGEWGERYSRKKARGVSLSDLPEADRKKVEAMPDPPKLVGFGEAVKTRQLAGGHPEAAHRTVTLMHLMNIAIRLGRKLNYDPVKERFVGDEEANALANQPMRAPWRL